MLGAVHDLTCKLEPINEHLSNMFSGRKCSDSMKSVMYLSLLWLTERYEMTSEVLIDNPKQSDQMHIFCKSTGPSQSHHRWRMELYPAQFLKFNNTHITY